VGSTFSFRLPLRPVAGPSARPERWIAEEFVSRDAPPALDQALLEQRVIVCDETQELQPLFRRYDDQVEFVATLDLEGVRRSLSAAPALAVVINAVDQDRLAKAVGEASERLPDLPIIGCAFPTTAGRAEHAGVLSYLLKPIRPGDLESALSSLPDIQRILIADDDEDTIWLVRRMLSVSRPKTEVLSASSGAGAIEMLREHKPDCLLLDVVMPDMDGWQVLEEMAADEALRGIQTVMVSAQDPQDEPLSSRMVVGTMGRGLSVGRVLSCSRALARELMRPS
jgi:CheY-like chemotaxis protein